MQTDFRGTKHLPGIRNNNPGNIRPNPRYKWEGQTGEADNFIIFQDAEHGIRALAIDIINKFERGLKSVEQIIAVYAPPNENLTEAYIKSVVNTVNHITSKTITALSTLDFDKELLQGFIRAIVNHENGNDANLITGAMIQAGIGLLPPSYQVYIS